MDSAIEVELERFGELAPLWIKYPDISRFSIGWRMGSGESYVMMFGAWTDGWTREQRLEHALRYGPVPVAWSDMFREESDDELDILPLDDDDALATVNALGVFERKPDSILRAFDEMGPFDRSRVAGDEYVDRTVLSAALTDLDPTFATELACMTFHRHQDPFVQGAAVCALGHVARRFGVLDSALAQPVFTRALAESEGTLSVEAELAAADVRYFAGWDPRSA
jgi:hypothetical protein